MPSLGWFPRQAGRLTTSKPLCAGGIRDSADLVAQPQASEVSLKSFVMRLIVADALLRDGLVVIVEQRRKTVATRRAATQGPAPSENERGDAPRRVALEQDWPWLVASWPGSTVN